MKTLAFIFAVLVLSASAASQVVFDTCWVYTTIPDNAGGRIEGQRVYIMKTVGIGSNRPLVGMGEVYFETDASGYIRMSLLRNSVVTMRSAIPSLSMLSGKNLTIPDVDSVDLRTLTSATVPTSYVVAVPNPRVRHGNDSARVNTIIFDGGGISSVLFNGQQSATITVSSGGTADVSDSLDVNARQYIRLQQLVDSLLALRGQAAALYLAINALTGYKDSATWLAQYHAFLARQNFPFGVWTVPTKMQTLLDTNVFAKSMMYPPIKATDHAQESYIPFGEILKWNTRYDNGVIINGLTGRHAYGWYRGLNPLGILANAPGFYLGTEHWQDNNGYSFSIGHYNGIIEDWDQVIDTLGNTHRTRQLIARRGDGRVAQYEWAADQISFANGSGISPASNDSLAMRFTPGRSLGAVYTAPIVDFFKASFRFNTTAAGSAYGAKIQIQRMDSAGLGYAGTYGLANVGGDVTYFGAPPSTAATAAAYPLFTEIGARHTKLHFDALFSRATFTGMQNVRLPARFATVGTDSALGTDAAGDIKKVALPAAGVSATALRDSLDANAREYVRTNIMTDSLNTIPRSGGGAVSTDNMRVRIARYDSTGWSARDSVMWYKYEIWEADEGPLGRGYTNPVMKTALVKFRIKYVVNYGHTHRWTLRTDSTNNVKIVNVLFLPIRTYRWLTNPYENGGIGVTNISVYANTGPAGQLAAFAATSGTYVSTRPSSSLAYCPMWLANGGGNNDVFEADVEVQVLMPANNNSTWYVTPSIE